MQNAQKYKVKIGYYRQRIQPSIDIYKKNDILRHMLNKKDSDPGILFLRPNM